MREIMAGLILVALFGMTAATAPAQDAATDRAILRAAVHHVRSTLPPGRWRFDPGILVTQRRADDSLFLVSSCGPPSAARHRFEPYLGANMRLIRHEPG